MPKYEIKGKYLLVNVVEPYSLELLLSAVRETGEICRRERLDKVLIDLRTINTAIRTMDRYDLGVEVSKAIGPEIKVAAVAKRSLLNYMIETVAVNRGAKLRAFSKMEAALKWLGVEEIK